MEYQAFLRFVCKQLPVRGGYGGLSLVQSYDDPDAATILSEWTLATRFSGLDIDGGFDFTEAGDYQTWCYDGRSREEIEAFYPYLKAGAKTGGWGFIKGINWITLLGEGFIERLGGEALIREVLDRPDIGIERIGGCLLIQAGAFPRLGAPEEGLPDPYVFVNRVLRMLRNPEPAMLNVYIGSDNTKAWQARFDLPDAAPVPAPPIIVPKPNDEWMKQTYWPQR